MKPIDFETSNTVFRGGRGDDFGLEAGDVVADLPAWKSRRLVVTCWHMGVWERLLFLFTGRVWVHVLGSGMPPIALSTENPFPVVKAK